MNVLLYTKEDLAVSFSMEQEFKMNVLRACMGR